ncbi:MAG: NAD(+) synthase, partial [Boseongicola sp. SB0673_bin_14]|nr:NAD(+) synthase [Boseongicola sp. SB0673_bin_14]
MARRFRLTLAQMNPTVGDFAGNAALARSAWEQGRAAGADLVMLTEMFITGYNTQDLVMRPSFVRDAEARLDALRVACTDGPALGIGGPLHQDERLYNAFHVFKDGRVVRRNLKRDLPNETVFDEVRVFDRGPLAGPFDLGGVRIGVPICEDAWHEDVPEALAESGAEILLVPNGSPYCRKKFDTRLNLMVARVIETGLPLVYLNMIGGQDDQVFDGGSFILNPGCEMAVRMPFFDESIVHVEFEGGRDGWRAAKGEIAPCPDSWELDYRAMVDATRDYVQKAGFSKVVLGLSGGVDSAAVACIAVDALGPENVRCVMMPSEYTSRQSLNDASAVASALGVRLDTVPIAEPVDATVQA